MLFKLLHTKQLNTALKTATSSRSRSIFSSNSWWEMCSSGNRTRSVRPGGKYRSIQHTKISEIQTGNFGQMERAPRFTRFLSLGLMTVNQATEIQPFENVKIYKEMYIWQSGRCPTRRPDAIHFFVNFDVFKGGET